MKSRSSPRNPPQTYVVRIYRRIGHGGSLSLAGTVEPVPGGDRVAFGSLGQLGDILTLPCGQTKAPSRNDGNTR